MLRRFCGVGTDVILRCATISACRPTRYAGPPGNHRWRAARRDRISRALSLDRHKGRAHLRLGRRHRSAGRRRRRRAADRRLGPSDIGGHARRCAPSLAIFLFQQIQGLRSFIEQGYVVAATDYPGLGTPETHPYLVGDSEARAVIDSVRVASNMPGAGGGRRFTVWGHSQGGQAALFTGMLAKTYAPELTLLGVAAAAPATDLVTLMNDDLNSVGGKNITAMTLWSWHRVYDVPLDKIVDPRAMPTIDRLAHECIEGPFDLIERQRTERPLEQHFLTVEESRRMSSPGIRCWKRIRRALLPPDFPVFLAQGTIDQIIRPDVTENYMTKLCAGRQQGEDDGLAEYRARPRRSGKHRGCRALDGSSVRWRSRSQRLCAVAHPSLLLSR